MKRSVVKENAPPETTQLNLLKTPSNIFYELSAHEDHLGSLLSGSEKLTIEQMSLNGLSLQYAKILGISPLLLRSLTWDQHRRPKSEIGLSSPFHPDNYRAFREEVVPAVIAHFMGLSGRVMSRGMHGSDLRITSHTPTGYSLHEDLEVKLVPAHSYVLRDGETGRKSRARLASQVHFQGKGRLLLIPLGSAGKRMPHLLREIERLGGCSERVIILHPRALELAGAPLASKKSNLQFLREDPAKLTIFAMACRRKLERGSVVPNKWPQELVDLDLPQIFKIRRTLLTYIREIRKIVRYNELIHNKVKQPQSKTA